MTGELNELIGIYAVLTESIDSHNNLAYFYQQIIQYNYACLKLSLLSQCVLISLMRRIFLTFVLLIT